MAGEKPVLLRFSGIIWLQYYLNRSSLHHRQRQRRPVTENRVPCSRRSTRTRRQSQPGLTVSAPAAFNFSGVGGWTFHRTAFGAPSDFLSSSGCARLQAASLSPGGEVGVIVLFDSSAVANANCIRSYGEAEHKYFTATLPPQWGRTCPSRLQVCRPTLFHTLAALHAQPPLLKSSITLRVLSAKGSAGIQTVPWISTRYGLVVSPCPISATRKTRQPLSSSGVCGLPRGKRAW